MLSKFPLTYVIQTLIGATSRDGAYALLVIAGKLYRSVKIEFFSWFFYEPVKPTDIIILWTQYMQSNVTHISYFSTYVHGTVHLSYLAVIEIKF